MEPYTPPLPALCDISLDVPDLSALLCPSQFARIRRSMFPDDSCCSSGLRSLCNRYDTTG